MKRRCLTAFALTLSLTGCVNEAATPEDDNVASSTEELTADAGRAAWTREQTPVGAADVASDDSGNAYLATSQRVTKYDPYGESKWTRPLNVSFANPVSVAVRGGTVYVAFDGEGLDPLGCGVVAEYRALTIAELSTATGQCTASRSYGDFPGDSWRYLDFEMDGAGNMYLARHESNDQGRVLRVRKLTPTGAIAWTRTYGDPMWPTRRSSKWFHDMAVSPAGDVYLTGWFGGTADFGGGPIAANPPPSSVTWSADEEGTGFLVKLSTNGTFQTAKKFGNAAKGSALAIGPDGRVGLGGRFKGTIAFGSLSRDNPTPSRDMFVASFDAALNPQWVRRWFGSASQELDGLGFDSSGYLNVTGAFWSTDESYDDLNIGSFELTTKRGEGRKMFVARVSPSGSAIWAKAYLTDPPPVPDPYGNGIWVDPTAIAITPNNRRILVAGEWRGSHPALGNEREYTFLTRILPF